MARNSKFCLTKWYADGISADGDAVIIYAAELHWRDLGMHYTSLLDCRGGEVGSRCSIRKLPALPEAGADWHVSLPALNLQGNWSSLRPPIRRTLFESAEGAVDWHCTHPMARAGICLDGSTPITGIGYVECLTLTIPPWKLPLKELHWGRFHSHDDCMIWIDWRGPAPRRAVYFNGEECAVDDLSEQAIVLEGARGRLELDRGCVLRQGDLGQSVFSGLSALARMVPISMLRVHESKWCSRGLLRRPNTSEVSGWAIHEVVRWPD